jgi:hypothetical protein
MRRRIMQWGAAVALALALPAAGTVATAGAAGWLPATPPAPTANGPSGATVAVNAVGDAAAAWTGDDGAGVQSLLVATRPAGGPWSVPTPVAQQPVVDAPAVAIDDAGNVTVVWIEQLAAGSGSVAYARSARRDALSGAWSPPRFFTDQPQSPGGNALPFTQVRTDAAGDVVATWLEDTSGIAIVHAAIEDAAGAWTQQRSLSDPGDAIALDARPQIAPDASGGALVGWSAQGIADPSQYAVQTSHYLGNGSWSAPADLVTTSGEAISPLRLVGTDGDDVAATWFQGTPATLWGALRTGGTWTVDDVSTDVAPACEPLQALGADPGGGATVVWKAQSSDGLDSVRLTAGGWEPRVPAFAGRTESAEDAAIDGGTVVLVAHDAATNADSLLATRREDGDGWSAPALLDGASAAAGLSGVDVAGDAAGDALASWTATDALGAKSIAAAAFQAAGPQLTAVSVPAGGAPGEQLAFSVAARSAFATVAGTSWDFGDGAPSIVGDAVSHAYAQAGDYTVTITSVDGVGNVTTTRRQVTIAAPATPPLTPPPPTTTTQPPPGGGTTQPPALLRPRIGGAPGGVLVLARGSRTLRLTVRNLDAVALRGAVTLVRPRGRGRAALTLASRHGVAFAASRRTTLTLRLNDRALRTLGAASGHRLRVRLSLRLRAADGRLVTAALAATLDGAAVFAGRARIPTARMAC